MGQPGLGGPCVLVLSLGAWRKLSDQQPTIAAGDRKAVRCLEANDLLTADLIAEYENLRLFLRLHKTRSIRYVRCP
jgi:hypothetical protein